MRRAADGFRRSPRAPRPASDWTFPGVRSPFGGSPQRPGAGFSPGFSPRFSPGSAEELWTGHQRISAARGASGSGGPSPSVLQELRTCSPETFRWRDISVPPCCRIPGGRCSLSHLKLLPGPADQLSQSERRGATGQNFDQHICFYC